MSEKIVVLSLLAHPDDAELLCAGTLLRLAQEHQAEIHIATFSVGECGSHSYDAQKTASIRRQEAQNSAAFAGATYHCLGQPDLGILRWRRQFHTVERVEVLDLIATSLFDLGWVV